MKKHVPWTVSALVLAAVAIAAAGCGGARTTNASNTGKASTPGKLAANQSLTIAIGPEPPSLDPGLATDSTSGNVLYNIMDPLVKLGPAPALKPEPNLAQSWDVKGATVTLHLRHDGRWTNGQPVTANDFVWSWLRTISPELGADYAYQFFGIKGAAEYNSCDPKKTDCDTLRAAVGVSAPDRYTLRIQLTSEQPWFLRQLSHTSFLAVNKATVEKYGDKWTEAKNIVTDGPFKLTSWQHDSELTLAKWNGWRGAKDVTLTKVTEKMITDGQTAEQAFDAGEVDVEDTGWPSSDTARLKTTDAYRRFAALGTSYYGLNVKTIPDVNQRRAMSFAIDRQAIVDNIEQQGETPATGFVPKGIPGYATISADDYLPATSDLARAKAFMAKVQHPVTNINLYLNNGPGVKDVAVALQSYWKQLGLNVTIHQMDWGQYLQFLGPPADASVGVFRFGWVADFPDAINFLELWTCHSGNNQSGYCNPKYDALVAKAKATTGFKARANVYRQLEGMLTGPHGAMPVVPLYWYTYADLQKPGVQGYAFNPMNNVDLTKVSVTS